MNVHTNGNYPIAPLLFDSESEFYVDEPIYDPDIHLQLTEPEFVVLLDSFKHVPKAPQLNKSASPTGQSQLAYTGPFRVLSDEGYRVLHSILQREMAYRISDVRHPAKIRFGAYRSKWLQEFNRCPRIAEHLSRITGDVQIMPTTLQSNYSHTNLGYAGFDRVDQFHRDSVPYVLILLACDMTETIGGELQLIERSPDEAFRLIEQYGGKVPKEFIRTIDYLGTNSCVFMQGSQIVHGVTNVESCKEPRITVVNSYMPTNPFVDDLTRYDTFRKEKTAPLEFAMHKIWRAGAQMFDLGSGKHPWPTPEQVVERLNKSIEELEHCRDLLLEKTTDRIGFYDEKTKKMSFFETAPTAFKVEDE
ncbi:unnamed protein product [Adineta ricciae]|uniref:Fe2OG dioxygenase domain-containing protein n=1 Tax=Adineta ricciae TaxID=249248 RepID=A0A814Z3V1_ADIRI|nr:unnamed protein product [Adineta ricciae]CAF1626862.1 unnamed protein product [Adineta ricciae]